MADTNRANPRPSFRCKIPDWRGIHNGFTLTLRPGHTALIGPNGAGKTTLLLQLKDIAEAHDYLTFSYSNLSEGGHNGRQSALERHDITRLATSVLSSEGENITLHFGPAVEKIGRLVAQSKRERKPLMVLLDALDSGASIDRLRDLKTLFDMILKDAGVLGVPVPDVPLYLIDAVNSYELASYGIAVDPRTGKNVSFSDYNDYATYICNYMRDHGEEG